MPADTNLLQKRKASEQSLEAMQVGININWHHQSGFYIGSGLQYNQINEKFSYHKETSELLKSVASYSSLTTIINKQIYNRFKMLDIPLWVGFQKEKKNWSVAADLGVNINISTRSSGQIFGQNETFVQYNQTNQLFKKNIGLSYQGNIGLSRKIDQNWMIGAYLNLQYFPKAFNLNSNPIEQKYLTSGLRIKCTYLLKKQD